MKHNERTESAKPCKAVQEALDNLIAEVPKLKPGEGEEYVRLIRSLDKTRSKRP